MKLKHWQGYGTVNATKEKTDRGELLHIKVTGEHECGLAREDDYDVFNWLVKRFDKNCGNNAYEYFSDKRLEVEEVEWNECHYRIYKKEAW